MYLLTSDFFKEVDKIFCINFQIEDTKADTKKLKHILSELFGTWMPCKVVFKQGLITFTPTPTRYPSKLRSDRKTNAPLDQLSVYLPDMNVYIHVVIRGYPDMHDRTVSLINIHHIQHMVSLREPISHLGLYTLGLIARYGYTPMLPMPTEYGVNSSGNLVSTVDHY